MPAEAQGNERDWKNYKQWGKMGLVQKAGLHEGASVVP